MTASEEKQMITAAGLLTLLARTAARHRTRIKEELRTLDRMRAATSRYRQITGDQGAVHPNDVVFFFARRAARQELADRGIDVNV